MVLPLALAYSGVPSQRVIAAVLYVVLVTAVAGMSAQLRFSPVRVPLHTTYADVRKCFWIASLWTGPAIIFSLQRGLIGILGIGALAIAIARVLKQVSTPNRVKAPISEIQTILFSSESRYVGDFGRNVIGSALVSAAYLGIMAELIGNSLLAIVCTGGSWFFLTWTSNDWCQPARSFQTIRASRFLMHAGLAIALTFFALPAHLEYLRLASLGQSPLETQNTDSRNEHLQSGIILFTKKKVGVHLFVPRSRTLHAGTPRSLPQILKIPFSGEYWFSRWPLLRPPASSLRVAGDPMTVSVTLTGFGSLVMQARQNIGRSFDVYCCHSINVVLRAARTPTDAVTMELLITESSDAKHNSQSLGVQSLANPTRTLADSAGEIGTTTYKFEMPRHFVMSSFDLLAVRFHLQPPRTRQSAMLSIERFELVPESNSRGH
jgi:hypothetical protein